MAENTKKENKFIRFINHPVYHAVGIIALAIAVITALIIGMNSSISSKIEKIEFEYEKFTKNKSNYENFIDDVAYKVISKKDEVKGFESLYIKNTLERVQLLSSTSFSDKNYIWNVNFINTLLKNDLEFLKIIFYQSKNYKLKKSILNHLVLFCNQNNIKTDYLDSGIIPVGATQYNQIYFNVTYSIEKIELLKDTMNFIAINSFEYDIKNNVYSKYLNEYNPNLEIDDKKILKDIIRDSFIFFLMHNKIVDKEELKKKITLETIRKLFGQDITEDSYKESLLSYIILLTKEKDLNKKVEIFNNNIIGYWFNKYSNYSILLTAINIDKITDKRNPIK